MDTTGADRATDHDDERLPAQGGAAAADATELEAEAAEPGQAESDDELEPGAPVGADDPSHLAELEAEHADADEERAAAREAAAREEAEAPAVDPAEATRAWIVYTVVRILAFAIPCAAVLLALPTWEWNWALGAVVGALVSGLVSYLFLRRQREAMTAGLAARAARRDGRGADDLAEDAELDAASDGQDRAAESSLARDVALDPDGDGEDEAFEEERRPQAHDLEPVDGAEDPEDVDASTASSLEVAPDSILAEEDPDSVRRG